MRLIGQLASVPGTNALMQFSYLQLLDLLTTVAFLINGVSEANPIVVFAMRNLGGHPLIGLAVVKVVAVGLGLYCWISGRLRLLHRTNVCFAALVAWNLIALIVGTGCAVRSSEAAAMHQLKKRDRALLAVLIGCDLRRSEVSELRVESMQQRDGRWCLVDLAGKGNRVRTVPMPAWTKTAIDAWLEAAGITAGRVFRPLAKGSRITGDVLLPQNIMEAVSMYAEKIGAGNIAPHDLRRTFAKLAHRGRAASNRFSYPSAMLPSRLRSATSGFARTCRMHRAIISGCGYAARCAEYPRCGSLAQTVLL